MLRILRVNIKSMLGGKRKRMSVTISLSEEEVNDPNVSDIVLFKTCEQIRAEFKGSMPSGFLASMQMVSIKDI